MEWEERHLDRKPGEEGDKKPALLGGGEIPLGSEAIEHIEIEREDPRPVRTERKHRRLPAQVEHGGEGEHAAREGVDEEHVGGLLPLGAAPDADQEVERDERQLEEDIEQEQVTGTEDPEHRPVEQKHQGVVFAMARLDPAEAAPDRQWRQQGGQQQQRHADSVDPEFVLNPDPAVGRRAADNPVNRLGQGIIRRRIRVRLIDEYDSGHRGKHQSQQGDAEGPTPDSDRVPGGAGKENRRSRDRQKDHQREDVLTYKVVQESRHFNRLYFFHYSRWVPCLHAPGSFGAGKHAEFHFTAPSNLLTFFNVSTFSNWVPCLHAPGSFGAGKHAIPQSPVQFESLQPTDISRFFSLLLFL